MNCARIYNLSMADCHAYIVNNKQAFANSWTRHCPPRPQWQTSFSLRQEDVLNGFFLYSLLLDKAERNTLLILSHDGRSQKLRLEPALAERNALMEGIGQESYTHACNLCCIMFEDEDNRVGG